jgi:hypothetical protein
LVDDPLLVVCDELPMHRGLRGRSVEIRVLGVELDLPPGALQLLPIREDDDLRDRVGNRVAVNQLHVDVEFEHGALGGRQRLLMND